jgi:3-dehydroquinate synthase
METLTVNLGDRSYPIHIGDGILLRAGEFLEQVGLRGKVAVVTNPTVAQLYLDSLHEVLTRSGFAVTPILLAEGEEHKDLDSLSVIYDRLIGDRFERKSGILALGGGVVGDLAGFAAATYLRGIPYVQVPTTLLAQVDSSVGGKTGVNHHDGKNLIGAFYQPKSVLIDIAVLKTLPRRELVAGLAEVIKYGIIDDAALFGLLEKGIQKIIGLDHELLVRIIAAACAIKARVVEMDEREDDYRAVLNFGHTIGHALEVGTGYTRFLHGEAVGVGMIKAAAISMQHGFCDGKDFARIQKLVEKAGLPSDIPSDVRMQDLVQCLEVDKKSGGGKIKFVMCAGIGKARFQWLTLEEILSALQS